MGLLDTLRTVLGTNAEADATRDADPEDLFGMSTAYVTMEADLGFRSVGAAALCFSGVDSTDFAETVGDVEAILRAGEEETGTAFDIREDSHGWEWVVLRDDDPEDLVTSIHFAADEFIERGYGSRILAAVFGFERAGDDGSDGADSAYWIYSFRRGAYYPFAPQPGKERNQRLEFKLESVLDGELGLEDDESYWYPMWPDRDGGHPWE
ncbi:PspA-associated protein PspAB [Halobellus sp. GM3]|uniref:PspA-associated protein PspAB n=1 Tax=Halobellus sp. GM3 TaxID=3458410 RepID=UPI00403DAB82